MEENLLACRPDEILVAVNALDGPVLILGFLCRLHYLNGFRLCHDLLPSGPITYKNMMPAGDKKKAFERIRSSVVTNEGKGSSLRGRDFDNWYNPMSKLCQGKSCLKHIPLTGFLLDGSIRHSKP